jgi:deoxyribonuclease-4
MAAASAKAATAIPSIGFHCGAGDGPKGTKLVTHLTALKAGGLPLTAAQIFISSPTSYAHCAWTDKTCAAIRDYVTKNHIRLYVHAPYIINPCTDDTSVIHTLLVNLLAKSASMGAEGVVVHVGKSLTLGEAEGLCRMRAFFDGVLVAAPPATSARLLIETCAGQGTEVARDLTVFGDFVKSMVATHGVARVGACVDTCHVFASGYKISTLAETVGKAIGWENVHLIHLNDSKTECGKRVDRHECIGYGKIGSAALATFCKATAAAAPHAAFVFETPDTTDVVKDPFSAAASRGATPVSLRQEEHTWFCGLFA